MSGRVRMVLPAVVAVPLVAAVVTVGVLVADYTLTDRGPSGPLTWMSSRDAWRYGQRVYSVYLDSHGGDFTGLNVTAGTGPSVTVTGTVCGGGGADVLYLRRSVTPAEARDCARAGIDYVALPVAARTWAVVPAPALRRAGVREYLRSNLAHAEEIAADAGVQPLATPVVADARRRLEQAIARVGE